MNKEPVEDKIAELLKPRFKIIEDYPGNTRPIGSVTTEIMTASYFRKYPANFKELEWWEERKEEEMPEYVKLVLGKAEWVYKVEAYVGVAPNGIPLYEHKNRVNYKTTLSLYAHLPATESEYNNRK